ncbi:MAG: type VI secretion system ATPase TssH [Proteobacteria bacterium]|nr:MAG: type VI secretion system ATPase TssH [Pseudomonadota bacterium]
MDPQNIKALLSKLNATMAKSIESAAGACIQRTHYEISVEHCLLKLLDFSNSDFCLTLKALEKDPEVVRTETEKSMERLKTGNYSKPKFSAILLEALSQAWNFGSLERGEQKLRSGHFLIALLRDQLWLTNSGIETLKTLNPDAVAVNFDTFTEGSDEVMLARPKGAGPAGDAGVLDAFTVNLVEEAEAGNIDPVIGRDEEIHQVIDILSRRRKNNPILLGEPGVGKSAIVEGLARFISEGKVPDMLQGVHIRTLDLGMLKAGASMKGEFEQRLKDVIDAVQAASPPVILFIDEAHTLIGAGGSAGSGDAANLLKPALARGQLRTIAATTWSEYKKYIEKDPALERRFQVVKVGEPSIEKATDMLRGLKAKYEDHHRVVVLDSAIATAVNLSSRFLSGRQLPDKAIDLLDTSCARVRLSLESEPFAITSLENKIEIMKKAIAEKEKDESLTFEQDPEIEELKSQLDSMIAKLADLKSKWIAEKEQVEKIIELQSEEHSEAKDGEEETKESEEPSSEDRNRKLKEAQDKLAEIGGEDPLISYRVTPQLVSQVISGWTGIPVGKMVKDELADLLKIDLKLKKRVIGQDHVADRIASAIKSSKAKVNDPNQPIGVFLAVGPSGTGKTEMALAIADTLFGGERFVVQINMSEYQEKHTVSRLIGSPPGYVGYGEGGVLSEAVRQRPYSVVLLDEVEKGHPDVMNLFYQVFDKGYMADGEGRHIDFKNTLIMMTSNLGSDITEDMCTDEEWPSTEELLEALRPTLNQFLKPALLARMTVLPYFPLSEKVMKVIVGLKLHKVVKRLKENHGIAVGVTSSVVQMISDRCRLVEAGARNIDAILKGELLPQIANALLTQLIEGETMTKLTIDCEEHEFKLEFEA